MATNRLLTDVATTDCDLIVDIGSGGFRYAEKYFEYFSPHQVAAIEPLLEFVSRVKRFHSG